MIIMDDNYEKPLDADYIARIFRMHGEDLERDDETALLGMQMKRLARAIESHYTGRDISIYTVEDLAVEINLSSDEVKTEIERIWTSSI